jgi:hypothetical protein
MVLKNGKREKGKIANPVSCISFTIEWPTVRKVKAKKQRLKEKRDK